MRFYHRLAQQPRATFQKASKAAQLVLFSTLCTYTFDVYKCKNHVAAAAAAAAAAHAYLRNVPHVIHFVHLYRLDSSVFSLQSFSLCHSFASMHLSFPFYPNLSSLHTATATLLSSRLALLFSLVFSFYLTHRVVTFLSLSLSRSLLSIFL